MNTPSPLIPQGSLQQARGKSNVRIAIFTILAIHVLLLGGLLIQGCKRDTKTADGAATNNVADIGFQPMTNAEVAIAPAPLVSSNPPGNLSVSTQTNPVVMTENMAPGTRDYVVVKGDILASIAKKNGVTVKEIEAANPGLVPTKLKIGQKIQLPASATSTTGASGNTTASRSTGFDGPGGDTVSYTVKPNDSLTKIARAHGTTPVALRKLNGLKTDQIKVGQKLRLPAGHGGATDAAGAAITSTNYITPLPAGSAR